MRFYGTREGGILGLRADTRHNVKELVNIGDWNGEIWFKS